MRLSLPVSGQMWLEIDSLYISLPPLRHSQRGKAIASPVLHWSWSHLLLLSPADKARLRPCGVAGTTQRQESREGGKERERETDCVGCSALPDHSSQENRLFHSHPTPSPAWPSPPHPALNQELGLLPSAISHQPSALLSLPSPPLGSCQMGRRQLSSWGPTSSCSLSSKGSVWAAPTLHLP